MIAAIGEGEVTVYDLKEGTKIISIKDASDAIFNSKGNMVAIIGKDTIRVFNLEDGSEIIHSDKTSEAVFNLQN